MIGRQVIKEGPCAFFLQPGEEMEEIEDKMILQEDQAINIRLKEPLEIQSKDDQAKKKLNPGEKFRIIGPRQVIIPLEADKIDFIFKVLLSKTEGVYVRNLSSGKIKTIRGRSYLPAIDEEFYIEYPVPPLINRLILPREQQFRMLANYCPFNHAVQIYDFQTKSSIVVIGPKFTYLEPQQEFTVISVSGGMPKQPNYQSFINLCLGPNFISDKVIVETADHALLDINLCYQIKFAIDKNSSQEEKNKIFKVKDYVANLCYQIAAIIRSTTSQITFEEFHKSSAQCIQNAIFGNEKEKLLPLNNLIIQNVDIQSIEPIDKQISKNLEKNVALAIQITTNRQEAKAIHEAAVLDEKAKQLLQQQKIIDQQLIQNFKLKLYELQAESSRVLSQSQVVSTMKALQEKLKIELNNKLETISLKMKSQALKFNQEINSLSKKSKLEIKHEQQKNALELEKLRRLSEIENSKIDRMTQILGEQVINALQKLDPLTKSKFLQGLGIKGNNILLNSENNFYCLTS